MKNILARFRRREACPEVLTGYRVNGRDHWQCQLDDDGHEWHERFTPPLTGRWKREGNTVTSCMNADASLA